MVKALHLLQGRCFQQCRQQRAARLLGSHAKRTNSTLSSVSGTVAPQYEAIRQAFAVGQSTDVGGAQIAVYRRGEKVVDLWTGDDPVRGRPLDGDGIVLFMSVTKGLASTVAHLLAERGLLDFDAPVTRYWPEFGKNGKETITVGHVMYHAAGLSAFPVDANVRVEDMPDWTKIIPVLENMSPFWKPGTQFLYAPYTFGFLIGEFVSRATGKTVGTIFREEIAEPLDLDLWIGLPEDQEQRVIPGLAPKLIASTQGQASNHAVTSKLDFSNPLVAAYTNTKIGPDTPEFFNTRRWHAQENPGANGIGDARSLAKLYAHVIGAFDGKPRLLSAETLECAIVPRTEDLPFAHPFDTLYKPRSYRFALGYQRSSPVLPFLGNSSFGHVGSGGRLAFADIDSGISVGYVCNNPSWTPYRPDPRWMPWLKALRDIAQRK